MRRLTELLLVRHRHNWVLLARFGIVGLTGVVVNLAVLVALRRLGPHFDNALVGIPMTDFHLRWYHVYSTIAFLVANLSNYQLNRNWAFRSALHRGWWSEYWPFLSVGLLSQAVGLGLLTVLMHPHSPLALPPDIFDDTTGLRTRLYWAQLIVIGVVTPLSFVLNKLWTFSTLRVPRQASPSSTASSQSSSRTAG